MHDTTPYACSGGRQEAMQKLEQFVKVVAPFDKLPLKLA
jgi:hypothetical protein